MMRVIAKLQLILLFSYVIFIAHTIAEPPEAVKNAFIVYRQRQREAALNSQSGNWAGAVHLSPPSGTFNYVSAQWIVPTLSPPPYANGNGSWFVAEWVGIDGFTCQTAILQAGTFSYVDVSSSGDVTTGVSAVYEWYSAGAMVFSDFSFAAGDRVEFSVTAESKSLGTVVMKNLSMGKSTSIALNAPSNSGDLCGMNAEWILEDPESSGLLPFSEFTYVTFQNCTATTTTGAEVDLLNSTLIDMLQNNTVLATTSLVSSTEFLVSYD